VLPLHQYISQFALNLPACPPGDAVSIWTKQRRMAGYTMMNDDFMKNLDGSGRDLIEVLPRHLRGEI
jgi:hypothetical protein